MALVFGDRVYETSTTTGNGTITLAGIGAANYRTFSDVIGNGNTCYYAIIHRNANEWEVGVGTVSAGALARTTVLKTSAGDTTKIVFSAGTKDVFCDLPAERIIALDAAGTGTTSLSGVAITAGAASFTASTFSTLLSSVTALATPSALGATALNAFASTVSGAVLMGYGTTADVTLKNRAGTDVLKIGPNTTAAVFDGAVTSTGNLTVGASTFVVTAATGAFTANGLATLSSGLRIGGGTLAVAGEIVYNTAHGIIVSGKTASTNDFALFNGDATTIVLRNPTGTLNLVAAGALAITGALTGVTTVNLTTQPAFVAGDKYLVIDATGNVHVSALGPAS